MKTIDLAIIEIENQPSFDRNTSLKKAVFLLEKTKAEHAALVAVAEAARVVPVLNPASEHFVWWNEKMKPLLANLAANREGKANQ